MQINLLDLTDGVANDLRNDPVPDFNSYVSRFDAINPIEWTHLIDVTSPNAGGFPVDAGETFVTITAAELFPVIWDIDYPSDDEYDNLYLDTTIPYAGGVGGAFSAAMNPAAHFLGRAQGMNNTWGAKRIALNPLWLTPGSTVHFWLQVDEDPLGANWKSSIDYSDLAIIFNLGALSANKSIVAVSGFYPPRVGHTSTITVRINISNPTLTSSGGPMYNVAVRDKFPAGSVISTSPTIGAAAIDGAGNLTWTVGTLQDGALNAPPAAGSKDFMDVRMVVKPTAADAGNPIVINTGAQITGNQVPLDPGDGTGTLYPFAFYSNPANFATVTSPILSTNPVAAANTGALTSTASIIPGASVTVTLTDDDLNTASTTIQTILLAGVNQTTGETETLTLTETGVNTGVFKATMTTVFGLAAGADNSGAMNARAGHTIRFTYNDAISATGAPAVVTADTSVIGGADGVIVSNPNAFPGVAVTITLTDADLNANIAAAETLQMDTVNIRTGETERLTYTETGVNTGFFTSSLPTAFSIAAGALNNGTMLCMSGDNLVTIYTDALTAIGNSSSVSATTTIIGGSDGVLTFTPAVRTGGAVTVTLVDMDLNSAPAAQDTTTLTLNNTRTGETETLTLTETGVGSGVFTSTVAIAYGAAAGTNNNGQFNTRAADVVTGSYFDARTGIGGTATITASSTVYGGANATLTAPSQVLPGFSILFTLTDADLNANPAAQDIRALTFVNTLTAESELMTFVETGINTGIFTVSVPTQYGVVKGPDNDGTFVVQAGHTLRVSYADDFTADGGTATQTASTVVKGGVTAALTVPAAILPNQSVSTDIADADLNLNPAAADSATATARNTITGELESIVLIETGPNTGVFHFSLPTAYNTAIGLNHDGTINAIGGHSISVSYDDRLTTSGGTQAFIRNTAITDTTNTITVTGPIGNKATDTLVIFGVTDPFSVVTVVDPVSGNTMSTTANLNGDFTFPPTIFPQGPTAYSVTSSDLAGNIAAQVVTVTVDTVNFVTVDNPPNNSVVNMTKLDITGRSDPGATVALVEPSTGITLTTTADFNGAFTFPDVGIVEGDNMIPLFSTDTMGNASTSSLQLKVDLRIILNITSLTNGTTYNTARHEIAGVTDADATLTALNPNTGATMTVHAGAAGHYTFGFFDFVDGARTVSVSAVDAAGNRAFTSVAFNVDTTNINDVLSSGTYRTPTVDIRGRTDPLSVVTMTHPINHETRTTTALPDGTYVFAATPFTDGVYSVTTTSVDPFGNTAIDSAIFTVDSAIRLVLTDPTANSILTTNSIAIAGETDANANLSVLDPRTDTTITATANASGIFTLSGISLVNGQNVMSVISVDPAGNNASSTIIVYYYADLGLTIRTPVDGSIVNTTIVDVSGTTRPGVNVWMRHPQTGAVLNAIADADGKYVFSGVAYPTGPNQAIVYAADSLGNTVSVLSDFLVMERGNDGTLETSERIVFGNPIRIRIDDLETYLNAAIKDTITVRVANPSNGDSENLVLMETAANSGVFTGLMPTVEGRASNGSDSGSLAVQYGDVATITYIDRIRSNGSLDTPIRSNTLITNDSIRIHVSVTYVIGGVREVALSKGRVSILEFSAAGNLIGVAANYTTDEQGDLPSEFIGRMRSDRKYRILMQENYQGVPYSQSGPFSVSSLDGIAADSRGVRTLIVLLDPSGYVYDIITGERINGADVTLYHANDSRVAGSFANYSHRPSTRQTNPQLSGTTEVGGEFEFISGDAASDLTQGDYYIKVMFDTNPALGNVYGAVRKSGARWPGLYSPYRGEVFHLSRDNQPVGMRIPLFRKDNDMPFAVEKTSNTALASVGDILTFSITVTNKTMSQTDPNRPVTVADVIPTGLTFVDGSAVYPDGTPVKTVRNGNTLFLVLHKLLAAGDPNGNNAVTIHYNMVVDTAGQSGEYVRNTAYALIDDVTLSNTAAAMVQIIADPIFDYSTLIGKVYYDLNGDRVQGEGEPGAAGVSILLDDATMVTTDDRGRYSVAGAVPGMDMSHYRVVKLLNSTLPDGTALIGDDTRFIRLSPGGINRVDFRISRGAAKKNKDIFVAMFDASAGKIITKVGESTRTSLNVIPEGQIQRARVAWFFDGDVGKLRLTTAYDSAKRRRFEFSQDRARDLFYPTYGDNSRTERLVDGDGKFYLDARTPRARLFEGNYTAQFEGTELAGIMRKLYGTKLELNGRARADGIEHEDRLLLFTSKGRQLHARTELRSTGGSHYYLAHSRLMPGSETVKIEIRDALRPERVVESHTLRRNFDYEIDFTTGRIRLLRPPSVYSASDSIGMEGAVSGNPIWIIAEYVYSPATSEYGNFGARWRHEINRSAGIGVSYLRENARGRDQALSGLDFHVRGEKEDILCVEAAHSTAAGMLRMASLDSGRTFYNLGNASPGAGNAFKGTLRLNFQSGLDWTTAYSDVDSLFNGGVFSERGVRRGTTSFSYKRNDKSFRYDYTRSIARPGAYPDAAVFTGEGSRIHRLRWTRTFATGEFSFEFFHRSNAQAKRLTATPPSMDSIAAIYKKEVNPRTTAFLRQQTLLSRRDSHLLTIGADYKLGLNGVFTAEGTLGNRGRGGKIGFEKTTAGGKKFNVSAASGYSPEIAANRTLVTAGMSSPVGRDSEAYIEYGSDHRAGESVLSRTLGLNHRYDAGRGLGVTISAERSEEISSLNGNYFTSTLRAGTDYSPSKALQITADAGFTRQSGSMSKTLLEYTVMGEHHTIHDITTFGEYEYVLSENVRTGVTVTKYTKWLVGAAFRPTKHDQLNVIAKAGRTGERRSASANEAFTPETRTTVLSLEGIAEISRSLQFHQKIASKLIQQSSSPLPFAKSHTTFLLTGVTLRYSKACDATWEYRSQHQPIQRNRRNGLALESGCTVKKRVRVGIGYNFSSFSDDAFDSENFSYEGVFMRLQGKM